MNSLDAFPSLTIGDLTTPTPIIQGGMGIGVSLSGLAAAVANAGGVGVIATAGIGCNEPDFRSNYIEANARALREQIRAAREKMTTGGVLGVNIMVALTNYASMVQTAIEAGADIIFSGAGLPISLPDIAGAQARTKLAPIVSSARAAIILCKKWLLKHARVPDAFVVEGPKAGGHLGFKPDQIDDPRFALQALVKRLETEVVDAVKPFEDKLGVAIPVIAAGGVYTGADIAQFLDLGASGVQMGTRFVCTHECDAAPAFKQAYLDSRKEDLTIIKSPVGLPGRAIRNAFINDIENQTRVPLSCPFHCISTCDYTKSPFCITAALVNASRGAMRKALVFAGANAYRLDAIISVAELMENLAAEYKAFRASQSTETALA